MLSQMFIVNGIDRVHSGNTIKTLCWYTTLGLLTGSLCKILVPFILTLNNVLTYLLRDFGGNSNSPTEMVSTAFREILITC